MLTSGTYFPNTTSISPAPWGLLTPHCATSLTNLSHYPSLSFRPVWPSDCSAPATLQSPWGTNEESNTSGLPVNWNIIQPETEYTPLVTSFITKCIDNNILTQTIEIYPKVWMNREIHSLLSLDLRLCKKNDAILWKGKYLLGKTIRDAKRELQNKQMMIDCGRVWIPSRTTSRRPVTSSNYASLPDEHNAFYTRFPRMHVPHPALALTQTPWWQARSAFRRVNSRKVADLDGVPGGFWNQLATILTDIFNPSFQQK